MQSLVAGSHFISKGKPAKLENDEGWMSSVAFSPMLKKSIGLGFIKAGDQRIGEKVDAVNPLNKEVIEVEITSPHFFDPEGDRLRG
jgi:sarcosine oxidase subunit alpha